MTDYSYEVREATRSAVQSALNNGNPLYNATHSAVDYAIRNMDFSEAIQAGIVQAAQMGLLTPEETPEHKKQVEFLEKRLDEANGRTDEYRERSKDNLKAFFDQKSEAEQIQAALLLATKHGHHYACPGGREPGTIYHGPCSGRCETIRQALGYLADAESKTHPSEIKKGAIEQTVQENDNG